MLKAIVETTKVLIGDDKKTIVVEGNLHEGVIEKGMFLKIAFNPSFGMTVPIVEVESKPENRIIIILGCDDEEEAKWVEAWNFEDEYVEIVDEE
ncbi:MAG: hypothetical protein MSG64_15335 [Pyrinomonadaceae bacterium MAG19_C2-C3]|nr:hypothetical protein [Pyrinomonadaceae bacterium MAG19_C2-C3]